ncbi:hypothetical protein ACFLT2_03415 [Acidobacteriota bacterium]
MGIPLSAAMVFLLTITLVFLFTIAMVFLFTISTLVEKDIKTEYPVCARPVTASLDCVFPLVEDIYRRKMVLIAPWIIRDVYYFRPNLYTPCTRQPETDRRPLCLFVVKEVIVRNTYGETINS